MEEVRGVTIYFNDGTKLVIQHPKQAKNEYDLVEKMPLYVLPGADIIDM